MDLHLESYLVVAEETSSKLASFADLLRYEDLVVDHRLHIVKHISHIVIHLVEEFYHHSHFGIAGYSTEYFRTYVPVTALAYLR